ncbi:hypothetical protein N7495_003963 [Penicillium taxi]|uniref:uncharacterized protein n=1 Tax=Penicillium taxi TaxID=168475 RepID=UPI002545367E|nr:uncharacterized protein N7495_003963 [Penicillium taxi]KAJ5899219.1 hypothetical protein N7495_003963 [Penicillium taxi]
MRLPVSSTLRPRRSPLITVARSKRAYNVAVLGGGITGLSAAWRLMQDHQCSHVTLYEKSSRVGGWMGSEIVPVDDGKILFEYGPRTFRSAYPGSQPLLYMALKMGLLPELIAVPPEAPSSNNRYIYYPDHLVRVPQPKPGGTLLQWLKELVTTLWNEPLFDKLIPGIINDTVSPARPIDQWQQDESIASFISRRFNPTVADNIVSSVIHGIYAGDIDKLSAQTTLGVVRNMEASGGILANATTMLHNDNRTRMMDDYLAINDLKKLITKDEEAMSKHLSKRSSIFTFEKGTQQLTDRLAVVLQESGKVDIRTNTEVQKLSKTPMGTLTINDGEKQETYDHVISTVPSPVLAKILSPKANHPAHLVPKTIEKLKQNDYATTVMVVNLYYPNLKLPVVGFGYLIPRSISIDQNPEHGLGVLFASASSTARDVINSSVTKSQDSVNGQKITVMLGGHYWDDWKKTDYPDHETAVAMATKMLQRHLGITDVPTVTRSRLQYKAIPQYTVGHLDRMYDLSATVKNEYNRRLVLAGNWYNGVGVGDCVRQGILAATYGIGRGNPNFDREGPWTTFKVQAWDLQGGIPTSPVRLVEVDKNA